MAEITLLPLIQEAVKTAMRNRDKEIVTTLRMAISELKKEEIDKVKNGEFDKIDNPLKNAPHTHVELAANEWKHKYDRETAAYPSATLKSYKYWPPVARVDNVYGDKNLFCSCPSMDEFKETAA